MTERRGGSDVGESTETTAVLQQVQPGPTLQADPDPDLEKKNPDPNQTLQIFISKMIEKKVYDQFLICYNYNPYILKESLISTDYMGFLIRGFGIRSETLGKIQ